MNILDWILLGFLALAGIRGLSRGLVRELFSVASPIAGLAAALFLYKWGADLLRARFHLQFAPEVIAFGILFLLAFVLVKVIAALIRDGLEAAQLDRVDRGLGFVLGLAEGVVLVAVILVILQVQPLVDVKGLLATSVFAKALLPIVGPEVAKAIDTIGKSAGGTLPVPAPSLTPPIKKP
jgi:membrane protein required for colicin V production